MRATGMVADMIGQGMVASGEGGSSKAECGMGGAVYGTSERRRRVSSFGWTDVLRIALPT